MLLMCSCHYFISRPSVIHQAQNEDCFKKYTPDYRKHLRCFPLALYFTIYSLPLSCSLALSLIRGEMLEMITGIRFRCSLTSSVNYTCNEMFVWDNAQRGWVRTTEARQGRGSREREPAERGCPAEIQLSWGCAGSPESSSYWCYSSTGGMGKSHGNGGACFVVISRRDGRGYGNSAAARGTQGPGNVQAGRA